MLEIVFLAPNNTGQTAIYKFIGRLVAGILLAILVGMTLDNLFNTSPWILLVLLLYVIFGSLYLLIKELK